MSEVGDEGGGFWWTQVANTPLNSPTNSSRKWTYSGLDGCGWPVDVMGTGPVDAVG